MSWLKKISIVFLLVTLSAMPVTEAFAGMNPFSGLTSALTDASSGAAVLNSPGHTTFYGGSLSVHVPSDTVQFISISPPSFSAGCSGINMYFGGFSFISGANFGKLIQAVMQAAPGYVINLAIRTLCPECSDILTELQKLAEAANGMGQNACHIAKSLVNGAASLMGINTNPPPPPPAESIVGNASKTSAGTGACSGFFSCFNQYAGDAAGAIKTVAGYVNNPGSLFGSGTGTKNQAAEAESKYVGNQNWMALTEAGYTNTYIKEIIMAMTGYNIAGKGSKGSGAGIQTKTIPPIANPEDLVKVIEYGAHPATCAKSLTTYGNNLSTSSAITVRGIASIVQKENNIKNTNLMDSIKVPTCWNSDSTNAAIAPETTSLGGSGNGDVLLACNAPVSSTIGELSATQPTSRAEGIGYNPYLSGTNPNTNAAGCGLLGNITVSLVDAIQNVREEKPLTATEEGYIQMAPFPLYQLINDAAVYPSAAGQMVENYAPLLAYLITRDTLLQWLSARNAITKSNYKQVKPRMVMQVGNMANKLYNEIQADDKRLAIGMTVQQGIMAQIDEMNQMIAGQAAMAGMAGNMMFTQSVAASAN